MTRHQQAEAIAWNAWQSAEHRAATIWNTPGANGQQAQAAQWQAECARRQWQNAQRATRGV